MEFLRFGSNIPGAYWGCCAIDIIQNFKVDPDAKASIQFVHGDSGTPMLRGKEPVFSGPTYGDIFRTRIRIGTFSIEDMPNHIFLASLTHDQITGGVGAKWLAILKEEGFEFIRASDNSVYSGPSINGGSANNPVYLFGLFRNIGTARIKDPFTPPEEWLDLPDPYSGLSAEPAKMHDLCAGLEDYPHIEDIANHMTKVQTKRWKAGKSVLMSEAELIEAGAPITMAGKMGTPPAAKNLTVKPSTKSLTENGNPSPIGLGEPVAPTPAQGLL